MTAGLSRQFHEQVALVTGATSGIGNAIARALGAGGARLGLVGRSLGTLEAVARAMGATAPRAKLYGFDLSDEAQVRALAAAVQEDLGGLDILVHSAGVFERAGFEATSDAAFDRQYRVNLRAPQILTRLLAPALRARRGQVVFVNSSVVRGARAGLSQYAATKAGLKAVADSFREEFNPKGVRVLSVFAGRTATPMQERVFEQEGRQYEPEHLLQPADIAAVVANALSLARTAEVTEIDIRPMMKT